MFEECRGALRSLPTELPATGIRQRIRLGRDYYVRVDRNDYSVHPSAIGHFVDIHASLNRVRVLREGQVLADHQRHLGRAQVITDPDHQKAASKQRALFGQLKAAGRQHYGTLAEVETRQLSDYDQLWNASHSTSEVA